MNISWIRKFYTNITSQIIFTTLVISFFTYLAIEAGHVDLHWGLLFNFTFQVVALFVIIRMNIHKPIHAIQLTTQKIAQGDFSARIEGQGFGEIFDLGQSINEMAVALETSVLSTNNILSNLRESVEAAESASRAKSIFLANISHELRTPMHGILSFARFGQQKIATAEKEKLKTYFDEIHDSGSRLMFLLNDLLDLSKLESGKVTYNMEKNDFISIIKSVASETNAFAIEKKVKIALPDPQEMWGVFDGPRLMQVLRNIVNNAIKFSNPESTITIDINQSSTNTKCKVTNKGPGIPKEELEAIFDKFVQSSKTRTGAGGTGLGLAICKEIIEHHQGKIWAESESGITSFIFEIPTENTLKEIVIKAS